MPATQQTSELKFIAYAKADFSGEGNSYTTQFNPASMKLSLHVERDKSQAIGNGYTTGNFRNVKPQDTTFEFTLDGTGAAMDKINVPEEINKFLDIIYHYSGDEHQPNFIKVLYGYVVISGVATKIDINYTLFGSDGYPLRAKISVTVASTMEATLGEIKQDKSSPDLTHKLTLKQPERLISLAYTIYDNNNYYSDVARVNNFNNFRRVPVNTDIYFPPLDK